MKGMDIKRKALAVGLTIALAVTMLVPGGAFAADKTETAPPERVF